MILHIFPYEKFTQDYIEQINRVFDSSNHIFLIYGQKEKDEIPNVNSKNAFFVENIRGNVYLQELKLIMKADKIILHSLFIKSSKLMLLTILEYVYPEKFFWNIWGADLYNAYWERNTNIKTKMREIIRKIFIKNVKSVGYIRGDYEFLKKHYKTNAEFFMASYSYKFFMPKHEKKREDKNINILLCNSATKECRYEETLDILEKYKDYPLKIRCVLSYPTSNTKYRNQVIGYGKYIFGEKFIPLTDFMDYEEYTKILDDTDLAIFNHNRQQGLGNIASLLYLGKRVFISPENACKSYFEDMGIKIYSTTDLTENEICKKENILEQNINKKIIDDFYSDEKFKQRWKRIFEDS